MPTDDQLDYAARGVAYRCNQLGGIALMLGRKLVVGLVPPVPTLPLAPMVWVRNATVESALVHARSLAYFLARHKPGEVAARDYGATVSPALVTLARKYVDGAISNHLAHAKYNDPTHPGAWPITELAVTLVGGVADAVATMPATRAAAFILDPRQMSALLEQTLGAQRTEPSANGEIARLTNALHAYLDHRPTRPDAEA